MQGFIKVRHGEAGHGRVGRGLAGLGEAWPGGARHGKGLMANDYET